MRPMASSRPWRCRIIPIFWPFSGIRSMWKTDTVSANIFKSFVEACRDSWKGGQQEGRLQKGGYRKTAAECRYDSCRAFLLNLQALISCFYLLSLSSVLFCLLLIIYQFTGHLGHILGCHGIIHGCYDVNLLPILPEHALGNLILYLIASIRDIEFSCCFLCLLLIGNLIIRGTKRY